MMTEQGSLLSGTYQPREISNFVIPDVAAKNRVHDTLALMVGDQEVVVEGYSGYYYSCLTAAAVFVHQEVAADWGVMEITFFD